MFLSGLRLGKRIMDFGFGETFIPNVGGLRHFFQHDPFLGYVILETCKKRQVKIIISKYLLNSDINY